MENRYGYQYVLQGGPYAWAAYYVPQATNVSAERVETSKNQESAPAARDEHSAGVLQKIVRIGRIIRAARMAA